MPTPLLGPTLDLWLDRLDAEGFRVGIRERLLVQSFLTRLAARGDLPESRADTLALLAPLVCTTPDSQRRYHALLREFQGTLSRNQALGRRSSGRPGTLFGPRPESADPGPDRSLKARAWAVLALLGVVLLAWHFWPEPPPQDGQQGNPTTQAPNTSQNTAQDSDTPPLPAPAAPPPRPSALLPAAWTVAGLSALVLAWAGLARLRRQRYLQAVRSDAQVEEHLLRDPHGVGLEAPRGPVRVAARGLRQRVAGEREVLDLKATLAATVRAAGAFSPRWRLLQHTPEYLALIDRRHPDDHLAAYADALVGALTEQGVTVQAYHFEGTPDHGCWRLCAGPTGPLAYDRSGMAELSARYAGHRLLVFAEAEALLDPLERRPRPWARSLQTLRQRAWFTPMPLASWGSDEAALDAQGFLVLPLPAEALTTLAGWFSAGDLALEAGPDWPLAFPPLLEHEGVAWVARQTSPPRDTLAELRYQLRAYLGPRRYVWLCACALFPALSPQLTLALGQQLGLDARDRALGLAALGALPWFRHGHMPAWLRQTLVTELDPESEARLRAFLTERLANAVVGGRSHPALARIATRTSPRRALWAWLSRGQGPARDVVLVDFLHRGASTRLAQALPEALRRRLFNNGLGIQGLRPAVLAGLGLLLAGALGVANLASRPPTTVSSQQVPAPITPVPITPVPITPAPIAPTGGDRTGPTTPASPGQATEPPTKTPPKTPPESSANTLRLPTVVGQSADAATTRLARLGFKVVRREQPGNAKSPVGSVLSQDPAGNTWAPLGSRVTLRVAGPAPDRNGWCCLTYAPMAQVQTQAQIQSQPAVSLDATTEAACKARGGRFFTDERQAQQGCIAPTPKETPPPAGWEGVDIREVQGLLAKAGLYRGPMDGVARNELIKALMLFQEKNRQVPDGLPGPRTLSLLRGERPLPAAPSNLRLAD